MLLIKRNALTLLGIIIGGFTGYLYWKFIGCNSGTCAITSKPINTSIYGAVMGGLLFSLFKTNLKNK